MSGEVPWLSPKDEDAEEEKVERVAVVDGAAEALTEEEEGPVDDAEEDVAGAVVPPQPLPRSSAARYVNDTATHIAPYVKASSDTWTVELRPDGFVDVQNTRALKLYTSTFRAALHTDMLDLGVQVAPPVGYASILARATSAENDTHAAAAGVFISVGVIDAGFRGPIQAISWFEPGANSVPAKALTMRLTVVQLAARPPRVSWGATSQARIGDPDVYDHFAYKLAEDAGYDIYAPQQITICPYGVAAISIPLVNTDPDVVAYVFGRSSFNRRGLIVRPTRWTYGTELVVWLRSLLPVPTVLRSGQRVAQLVALTHELPWVSASQGIDVFPCSTPPPAKPPVTTTWIPTDDWQAAPQSVRGDRGFGSTGE